MDLAACSQASSVSMRGPGLRRERGKVRLLVNSNGAAA